MFYLEHLYQICSRSKFISFFFVFLTVLFFNLFSFRSVIDQRVNQFISSRFEKPHFYGLVDNSLNSENIRRKLISLPGVSAVVAIADTEIKSKVREIIGELDAGLDVEQMDLDYSGLKVVFDHKIQRRGQELLRNYLTRLTGEDRVILGPTLVTSHRETASSQMIRQWGFWILLCAIGFLWIVVCYQFLHHVFHQSSIIEKFKRKNHISEKTSLLLFLLLACLVSIPQLYMRGSVDVHTITVLFLTLLTFGLALSFRRWT